MIMTLNVMYNHEKFIILVTLNNNSFDQVCNEFEFSFKFK